jgi:hypothetical protein
VVVVRLVGEHVHVSEVLALDRAERVERAPLAHGLPGQHVDPAVVAKLADTIPAVAGVVVILSVVLGFVAWVFARVTGNNTEATKGLTAVLTEMKSDNRVARTEDHAWHTEKIRILSGLTAQMQGHGEKLDAVHADVLHIKTSLGKD